MLQVSRFCAPCQKQNNCVLYFVTKQQYKYLVVNVRNQENKETFPIILFQNVVLI